MEEKSRRTLRQLCTHLEEVSFELCYPSVPACGCLQTMLRHLQLAGTRRQAVPQMREVLSFPMYSCKPYHT